MAPSPRGRREEAKVKEGRRITIQPSQEPSPTAGVTAEDERFSWKVAFVAMAILSAVAAVASIYSLNPFALGFNISLVYLPTTVLFLGLIWKRVQRKTAAS